MSINVFWNPNDKASVIQLSNNNLTAFSTTGHCYVRANKGITKGKYYF